MTKLTTTQAAYHPDVTPEGIGTLHVTESREVTQRGEYAGAGHTMRLQPGDYAITRDRLFCYVAIDAVNVRRWFQNRIGAALGSCDENCAPFACTYHMQTYEYCIARMAAEGKVTLHGYRAVCAPFVWHTEHGPERRETWRLERRS